MQSFAYRKVEDYDDEGIPFLIETAFGWLGEKAENKRRLVSGVNWSPGIVNPFRTLGEYRPRFNLVMTEQRAGSRGAGDLRPARRLPASRIYRPRQVRSWWCGHEKRQADQRRRGRHQEMGEAAEGRGAPKPRLDLNREIAMLRRPPYHSIRDAAWSVMEAAYMKAIGQRHPAGQCQCTPATSNSVRSILKRLTDEQLAQLVARLPCR